MFFCIKIREKKIDMVLKREGKVKMNEIDKERKKMVICGVEEEFGKKYRNQYNSIRPILEKLDRNEPDYYLIYGLVQSGKSLCIAFLLWMIKYKYNKCPIFLTKNLSSIRKDIMEKLTNGLIVDIVKKVTTEKEYGWFLPKMVALCDFKKSKNQINSIPVFLMNRYNFKCLKTLVDRIGQENLVFCIDEYHAWFTEQKKFIENQGLTKVSSGQSILYWLFEICKNRNFMIGVTATPFRILADSHLYPKKSNIISLKIDPPLPNLQYYGFNMNEKHCRNIKVKSFEMDKEQMFVINIIKTIWKNRFKYAQCPFIFIPIESQNFKQNKLKKWLISKLQNDLIYIKTFNQQDPYHLDNFFSNIPNLIKQKGIIVLIAARRIDTGVTVKPSKPDKYIWGITDEILCNFKSLEHDMQLMRLRGWFPEKHTSHLWVPIEQVDVYKMDMWKLADTIVNQYDGHPRSLSTLPCENKHIQHIFGSQVTDLFRLCSKEKTRMLIFKQSHPPNNIPILPTHFYPIFLPDYSTINISQLKNKSLFKKYINIKIGNTFQIGYSKQRYSQILRAIVNPNDQSNWQVNGFLYGPQDNMSNINTCWKVIFDQPWSKRFTLQDYSQLAFQASPTCWFVYLRLDNGLYHKYINKCDQTLSEHHQSILSTISQQPFTKIINPFIFFRQIRVAMFKNGSAHSCSKIWKNVQIKTLFTQLLTEKFSKQEIFKRGIILYSFLQSQHPTILNI